MNPIIEAGAATTATTVLVNLFKLAWPAAPSWALVVAALLCGLGTAVLISLSGGEAPTIQGSAGMALQGIFAAAAAAGLDQTGQVANVKRTIARMDQVAGRHGTGV